MKKILVIDDDREMAETVEMVLSGQYMVEVETNNTNVIDTCTLFAPDLIILDNWVGQKDASDIIKDLQPYMAVKHTPVVLFSGHPDVSALAGAIKADAWLSKPFALNDLYACVNNILN